MNKNFFKFDVNFYKENAVWVFVTVAAKRLTL